MTKEIEMLEPYPFNDTTLLAGACYKVGGVFGGVELTDAKAKMLVEEGWAKEVA